MQKFTQVDAFTSEPFRGNPAAVLILSEEREAEWMQQVAAEMNLAETAFVRPMNEHFSLRWFTPMAEVELCGHATLASAHVLWEQYLVAPDAVIRFQTLSGELTARRDGATIELDFPREEPRPVGAPEELARAIDRPMRYVGKNRFDFIVELESEAEVLRLIPDYGAFQQLDARGVIVTARSERSDRDFVSRFFAPALGVDEDPVTGSAHCCLAPYWAKRLGKEELVGYQASRRGGYVGVKNVGDRVLLRGEAVTIIRGELLY